jgi:hypothetical protein
MLKAEMAEQINTVIKNNVKKVIEKLQSWHK